MRMPAPADDDRASKPLLPIFVGAIVFGGAIRIIEIVVIAISTREAYFDFWLTPRLGPFGVGDLVLVCALLFLGVSVLSMIEHGSKAFTWTAILFSLLLVVYCGGLRFLCERLQRESGRQTSVRTSAWARSSPVNLSALK